MDETPNHNNAADISASPPLSNLSQPNSALKIGIMLILTLLGLVLGGLGTLLYQRSHVTTQTATPQTSEAWRDLQTQIQALQQSQQQLTTETQNHRQRIQELSKPPSSATPNWDIQKARYYIELAQINAEWAHNIPGTLDLLRLADQILAQNSDSNLSSLRQALAQDISALEQIPVLDPKPIVDSLRNLSQAVEQLNVRPDPTNRPAVTAVSNNVGNWRDNLENNLQQLQNLISIRHQDDTSLPIFGPNYYALLRETIRMDLQQAELGVITQQQTLYSFALQTASNNIATAFNVNYPKTQTLLKTLQELQAQKIAYPNPKLHAYQQLFTEYDSRSTADLNLDSKVSS